MTAFIKLKKIPLYMLKVTLGTLIFIFFFSTAAFAEWPTASQWIPVYKNYSYLQDSSGDSTGSRNIVSDATHPAAFFYNDGSYIYFRLRLDQDPSGSGGQGLLQAFGWGVVFDTNNNPNDYEWMIMIDGVSKNEAVSLYQNTIQGILGDPSDKPEILSASVPVLGNFQVGAADSSINGDQDYFLDARFPYSTFKTFTGLSDQSPLRMFFGASPSANNLSQNGGDLVGGSDLVTGFSDYVTAAGITLGPIPSTTGTINFASDLTGNTAVSTGVTGDAIFVKVIDMDVNVNSGTPDTLSVTLSSSSSDAERINLTETGVNTGVFTGSIVSKILAVPVQYNGTLDVTSGNTVTATYSDARDASNNLNQFRTDTITLSSASLPQLNLVKSADTAEAAPGTEITYKIHYINVGSAAAYNAELSDALPAHASYVTGSMRLGDANSTYATAAAKTDQAGDDEAEFTNNTAIFRIPVIAKNDNSANAGTDEGNIFYKIIIQ